MRAQRTPPNTPRPTMNAPTTWPLRPAIPVNVRPRRTSDKPHARTIAPRASAALAEGPSDLRTKRTHQLSATAAHDVLLA
jgi:hypothetical protein